MFEDTYVVVIDDDPSDADVLISLLSRLGITIDWLDSHNVLENIEQITRPQAIFLDLEMPGINGYQVLEWLHAHPDYADIPIVAYTAHSSEIGAAKQAGFHSFLGKPLRSKALAEQVARIINDEPVWDVR